MPLPLAATAIEAPEIFATGAALITTNGNADDVPGFGVGLATVTQLVASLAMSAALIAAVNSVLLT